MYLVFGLALSIGAISLISNKPTEPNVLYIAIGGFGFSFLILIQIWFRFTEIMSVLPVETTGTRVLNTLLLLLVALEPYLSRSDANTATPSISRLARTAQTVEHISDLGSLTFGCESLASFN